MITTSETTDLQVDKSGDRVRDMFAEIAPRYDLMNHLLSLGIDIRWRKAVLRQLDLAGNQPVLDCCTGTGDLALMLANRIQGRLQVVATDFCCPMLELAEQKHRSNAAAHPVRFLAADTQYLPFDDQTFQAVTVAFGLRNVQDTMSGIREMIRVCIAGGQVCVLEFSKPTLPGFRHCYEAYFKYVLPRIGQRLAKNNQEAYDYLPNSVAQFPSGQALAEIMECAGLIDVRVIPLTFGVASIYIGRRPGHELINGQR